MSNFPSLQPAFTVRLYPSPGFQIGQISTGDTLTVVPISKGQIVGEDDFHTPVNADLVLGADYVRIEQSQTHARINVNAVLRNKADGALILYAYKGIIEISPEFLAVFAGSPDAATTDYGNSFTHITFETGAEQMKALEHGLFVGSAHFVMEGDGDSKRFFVETKVSQVVA